MTDETNDDLPQWAKDLMPIRHAQAAKVLGMSESALYRMLLEHPHFERRGKANVYYPDHIAELRKLAARPRS